MNPEVAYDADCRRTPRRTFVLRAVLFATIGLIVALLFVLWFVRWNLPPTVALRLGDRAVELKAHTYCSGLVCVDGHGAPVNAGSPAEIVVDSSRRGWKFTATFRPAGQQCGRAQTVPLERRGDRFVLRPAGHEGTYDVDLSGRGRWGDGAYSFRWTTPADGPLPVPEAHLAVLSDAGGRLRSHGVGLNIENLSRTPNNASALITVQAANGAALSFEASRAVGGCQPEGSLRFDGPDEKGHAAAILGPSPFTYEVVLSLDGTRYVALAKWPDDEIDEKEPYVPLAFVPPLPAPS